MLHIIRILTVLIVLPAAGCHGHKHPHPYRDEGTAMEYRNTNQHWSRGPHTDH
ncbi:hypothetical protein [Komagataeibacter sp. FXV3]|uniref:hypothetical protein n=1 Tax=Komagataeibacter sp. FXV3 TaxID=2608998 RepID=UPI00187B3457|nr:hypothetical protein [Komagataeibacter sp. FXV3]